MCTAYVRLLACSRSPSWLWIPSFFPFLTHRLSTKPKPFYSWMFARFIYLWFWFIQSFLYSGGLNAFAVIKSHFFYIWSILVSLLRCHLNIHWFWKRRKKICSNLNWSNFMFVYLCYSDLISHLLKFHLNTSSWKDGRKRHRIDLIK